MNLELGFKRVAWVISGFGLIGMATALVGLIVNADQGVGWVNALLAGAAWFGFVWIVFFTTRWLVRGFQGKEK